MDVSLPARSFDYSATLRLLASPFVWAARTYALGARNLIHGTRRLLGREPRVVRKVARQVRNYDGVALSKARDLFVAARPFVDVIKRIGLSDRDSTLLAHVRATSMAMASQGFDAVYDN